MNNYQKYLTLDGVTKAFDRAKVDMGDHVSLRNPSKYNRARLEQVLGGTAEIDQDVEYAEYMWVYGNADVQVDMAVPYKADQEGLKEDRESAIFRLLDELQDAVVARIRGSAYIVGRMGAGTFVVVCGEALCERVIVREDIVEVPDPELLQEATKDIPLVKKVTPVYGWRCNDAELESGVFS